MTQQEPIPHLFRTEFRKITAVLCKYFGIENIQVAEDIASETFLLAVDTWTYKGIPANPTAWLYTVAKNKAKNHLHREKIFSEKISGELIKSSAIREELDINLSEQNFTDSQLQMLFAICHPSIPTEGQIGLALRILCGFGIDEIANAFLSNRDTINKRLFRVKEKLRQEKMKIELPGKAEINERLDAVLTTLYLLFSEGYYSETHDNILREDLCSEAMRLTYMLIESQQTNLPKVNALYSLMCFHSSRFPARKNENGGVVLYHDQDESLWDQDLIDRGVYFFHESSKGKELSAYHIEASIAYWHTIKSDTKEKWDNILQLYNKLLVIEYSPIAALNRTYALSKVKGKEAAIGEAEKLNLATNHFYFVLLGELYTGINDKKAKECFQKAISLAKTETERRTIQKKVVQLTK